MIIVDDQFAYHAIMKIARIFALSNPNEILRASAFFVFRLAISHLEG